MPCGELRSKVLCTWRPATTPDQESPLPGQLPLSPLTLWRFSAQVSVVFVMGRGEMGRGDMGRGEMGRDALPAPFSSSIY